MAGKNHPRRSTCVDTETTGLDTMNAQLVGISFAVKAHHAAYLPLAHHYPGAPDHLNREHALQKLKSWLESAQHKKLGQNLKYDQQSLPTTASRLRASLKIRCCNPMYLKATSRTIWITLRCAISA